ncbi:hypothetical protein [Streptomyces sp. SD15]
MTDLIRDSFPGHEVNVVFARGVPLDALTEGLRGLLRDPLAQGEGGGWAWAVHDMCNWEAEDYDPVNYTSLCPGDAEVVVFVTEPCSAKGFPPDFSYYRDGRMILHFSFEDLASRVGDNPDHLSPELLAADLIGPDAVFDNSDDDHRRLVKTIADFFELPSPPLSLEAEAK